MNIFNPLSFLINKKPHGIPRLIEPATDSGFASSYDGTQIYWERHDPATQTQKRPIVFCYGLVCSINQWRWQLQYFKENGHSCILFDYRGHHNSEFPNDEMSLNFAALAKDLKSVLDANKITTPVHVFGHSMGCNVAIDFALAYPRLTQSLNLFCGTLDNPFKSMIGSKFLEKTIQPLLKVLPRKKQYYTPLWRMLFAQPELAKLVVSLTGFNRLAVNSEDVDTYIKAVSSVNPLTFLQLINEMVREPSKQIIGKIKTPALVLGGANDLVTPVKHQIYLADQLINSQFVKIPAGSHNVQLDFGDYTCLKVKQFWKAKKIS